MYGRKVHHAERKAGWNNTCEINLKEHQGSVFYVHVSSKDGFHKAIKVCRK
jgi:hypothetical protein